MGSQRYMCVNPNFSLVCLNVTLRLHKTVLYTIIFFQPYVMRYLDALRTAILGLDQLIRKGIRIEPPSYTKGVCGISDAKPWPLGRELMDAIINVSIIVAQGIL